LKRALVQFIHARTPRDKSHVRIAAAAVGCQSAYLLDCG
jgi:hypothetical protein